MAYLLELRQVDGNVAQEIEDKDTLWIILEAMLDGDCPVECLISKINNNALSEEDIWNGKGECRHHGKSL